MSDITQTLTNLIVSGMNKKRHYTEYEKQVFTYGVAYPAKSAHPFQKNGAPFRLKLSIAQ